MIPILQYTYTGEINKSFIQSKNYLEILEMHDKLCRYQTNKLKPTLQIFILAYFNIEDYQKLHSYNGGFIQTAIEFIGNLKPLAIFTYLRKFSNTVIGYTELDIIDDIE